MGVEIVGVTKRHTYHQHFSKISLNLEEDNLNMCELSLPVSQKIIPTDFMTSAVAMLTCDSRINRGVLNYYNYGAVPLMLSQHMLNVLT